MSDGMEQFEFFGNESQVKLQLRCYRLWHYLKAHPRLSFVGRAIGIDDPTLDEVELLHTGARADNIPSQRVCRNCGLEDSGMHFAGVVYPPVLEQGAYTR